MRLRQLQLKSVYRSEDDDILRDFYIPALRVAHEYDRAVGFFSAAALSCAAQGLSAFVRGGGRMRLVVGGELAQEDVEAISRGYDHRKIGEKLSLQFDEMVRNVADELFHRRLELLAFLVGTGRLDIKVALRRRGMYHEKIGIFRDSFSDLVVFQGSANETVHALLPDFNFESVNVFQGWRPELADHVQPHLAAFERLWGNHTRNTEVIEFPEALRNRLVTIAKNARLPDEASEQSAWAYLQGRHRSTTTGGNGMSVPGFWGTQPFRILPHQQYALNAWKAHDFRGILALATGAGKTVTALYGAAKVYASTKRLCLVIAVPYQNLADQWVEELRKFGVSPFQCYASNKRWLSDLSDSLRLYEGRAIDFICCVVVNRTLGSSDFQRLLSRMPGEHLLFVGDECHHHMAPGFQDLLPKHAKMRLGLSATPEHVWDQEANQRLQGYYGPIVARFTLQQALDAGILTPYRYEVIPVALEEDELQAYLKLSAMLGRAMAGAEDAEGSESQEVMRLLLKRARLLGGARNKLVRLGELLRAHTPTSHTLFYCGEGTPIDLSEEGDAAGPGEEQRHVDMVGELLERHGWNTARFTAEESRSDRERVLDEFKIGLVDALVAIRCLDEGVDVPACRKAYILASTRNPRQFIQRRGRILRRAPGKDHAEIIDFVVVPPSTAVDKNPIERRLLIGELQRVAEFARSAMNPTDAVETLQEVLTQHHLHHYLV